MTKSEAVRLIKGEIAERERRSIQAYGKLPMNYTHYYQAVTPIENGEAKVDVYAVRWTGRGSKRKLLVKCVQKIFTDRDYFLSRDIFRGYCGGFQIDFSDMTSNCRHYYRSIYTGDPLANGLGKWSRCKYEGLRTGFLLWAHPLNGYEGTKFEHSGFEKTNMHILHFNECYKISKAVEFLAKAELIRFIRPAFVKRLRDDKKMFNLFRCNFKKIKDRHYGIQELTRASANGYSLEEASDRIAAAQVFKADGYRPSQNLPAELDKYEIYKWCRKNKIHPEEYRRYVGYIHDLGEDITAFGVTMPRDFKTKLEEAEAKVNRIRERERRAQERRWRREHAAELAREKKRKELEAKRREKIQKKIAAVARQLKGIVGKFSNGYVVAIPSCSKDLVKEGHAMRNCIGSMGYDFKIADRNSIIIFLRGQDGRKNVDVELAVYGKGKRTKVTVAQCYNPCNQNPPDEAREFANELAAYCQRVYRKAA